MPTTPGRTLLFLTLLLDLLFLTPASQAHHARNKSPCPHSIPENMIYINFKKGTPKILCGCEAMANQDNPSNSVLRCQANPGMKYLTFNFQNDSSPHEIVSTNALYGSDPLLSHDPYTGQRTASVTINLKPMSVFTFKDNETGLIGEILVPKK